MQQRGPSGVVRGKYHAYNDRSHGAETTTRLPVGYRGEIHDSVCRLLETKSARLGWGDTRGVGTLLHNRERRADVQARHDVKTFHSTVPF